MEANSEQEQATPKITSEVKVKDPRRVAQGKRLAAISREAKARKAREREMSIRKEEVEKCEKESYSYAILPVIAGVLVVGGGYYFYQRKKDQQPDNDNEEKQQPVNSNLENFQIKYGQESRYEHRV